MHLVKVNSINPQAKFTLVKSGNQTKEVTACFFPRLNQSEMLCWWIRITKRQCLCLQDKDLHKWERIAVAHASPPAPPKPRGSESRPQSFARRLLEGLPAQVTHILSLESFYIYRERFLWCFLHLFLQAAFLWLYSLAPHATSPRRIIHGVAFFTSARQTFFLLGGCWSKRADVMVATWVACWTWSSSERRTRTAQLFLVWRFWRSSSSIKDLYSSLGTCYSRTGIKFHQCWMDFGANARALLVLPNYGLHPVHCLPLATNSKVLRSSSELSFWTRHAWKVGPVCPPTCLLRGPTKDFLSSLDCKLLQLLQLLRFVESFFVLFQWFETFLS